MNNINWYNNIYFQFPIFIDFDINSAVGKTSFILRYTKNTFNETYLTTIGIDFLSKNALLPNGEKYKVLFYDTAGQEKYLSIAFNLLKGAEGIILMYDITKRDTFESITGWIKSIKEVKGENFPIALIGNKCDLNEERQVDKEEGENEAKKNGFLFFETSNKDGTNVEEATTALISKVVELRKKQNTEKDETDQTSKKSYKLVAKKTKKKRHSCCQRK